MSKKVFIPCTPKILTPQERDYMPSHLAVLSDKRWNKADLTIGFMEQTSVEMRDKILLYANKWSEANSGGDVTIRWTQTDPTLRITFADQGYWSYVGLDNLGIPRNRATMCLQGFTVRTAQSEWERVVTHEFGHALGFPHEHMRPELVARLDRAKTIAYFRRHQGWDATMTTQQVLTPLDPNKIKGTPNADEDSIMCYQLPGEITKDGKPIRGGKGITANDLAFVREIYPVVQVPPPPPPPIGKIIITLSVDVNSKTAKVESVS